MSAIEPLCSLIGDSICKLSKEECIILEAELFACVCSELKNYFRYEYREYFSLMKFSTQQESAMLEANFIRLIIRDIVSSEQYTLEGIARYTDTHEDIIQEIFAGINLSPSAVFLRRIIELHRTVRHDLYSEIMKKIATQYLAAA